MTPDPIETVDVIVDASIGVKWLVPESHSAEAATLMVPGIRRHVPSLFFTEVSQTIWKKSRIRGEFSTEEAREIIERLLRLPLVRHPGDPLYKASFEIALETGRSVYDSVYLALVRIKGWKLVTADERLYNALKGHPLHTSLVWASDIPSLSPIELPEEGVSGSPP